MGFRRAVHSNKLRAVVVFGVVALFTSACSGRGIGNFHDSITGNWLAFSVYCTSGELPNGNSCNGAAHGVIDGKQFIGRTLDEVDAPSCDKYRCFGGRIEATGTGGLGGVAITFDMTATDGTFNHPSSTDTISVTINGVPSATITCHNNCFTLITSSYG